MSNTGTVGVKQKPYLDPTRRLETDLAGFDMFQFCQTNFSTLNLVEQEVLGSVVAFYGRATSFEVAQNGFMTRLDLLNKLMLS